MEKETLAAFENDIRSGALRVEPLEDRHAVAAAELIATLSKHPLRTLDALHVAIARGLGAQRIATADRVMAAAANALALAVTRFD